MKKFLKMFKDFLPKALIACGLYVCVVMGVVLLELIFNDEVTYGAPRSVTLATLALSLYHNLRHWLEREA